MGSMLVLKPSEAKIEAQKMVAAGQMPSLEDLMATMAETREQYQPKILEARQQDEIQKKGTGPLAGKEDPQNKSTMTIEPLPENKQEYKLPVDRKDKRPLTKT